MNLRPASTLLVIALSAGAQSLDLTQPAPARTRQYVTFTADPQLIPANRPTTLELRFHVAEGFHINSHTPHSELLIPTSLELTPSSTLKPTHPDYPAGHPYQVAAETLDVYTGTFLIRLPLTALPGEQTLSATLHYQACDRSSCFPPRSLPVQIPLTAR